MAREAGAEGQVVPQQWLAHTTATGVPADDRRRLDLVVYEATANGGALCCDATLVSPLTRTGHPHPCTVEVDEAALKVAERRKHCTYPELARGRPQKLLVLGSEIGGPLEHCCAGFRSRPGPAPSPPPAASSTRHGVFWLGQSLVGSPFCRGPARRCENGLGPCLAGSPPTWAERWPCTGPGARPRRRRRAQPRRIVLLLVVFVGHSSSTRNYTQLRQSKSFLPVT